MVDANKSKGQLQEPSIVNFYNVSDIAVVYCKEIKKALPNGIFGK